MFYTELTFHIFPYVEDIADAIIAELGDLGYDSFSYSDDGFKAFILPSTIHDHLEKNRNREPRLEQNLGRKLHAYPRARPDSGKSRIPSHD